MTIKNQGGSKKIYTAFIIAIIIMFIICGPAGAQTFMFIDETGTKITSGFKFFKNLKSGISFSTGAPLGKFYFTQSLSFEEPSAASYTFQSEIYAVDASKTGSETLSILAGKTVAPTYSVNMIYLKHIKNAAAQGSSRNTAIEASTIIKHPFKGKAERTSATLPKNTATLAYNTNTQATLTTVTKTTATGPVIATPNVTPTVNQPIIAAGNTAVKKSVSLNLGTGGGSVSGTLVNSRGEPFPEESVVITVSNGSGAFTKSVIVTTSGSRTAYPFQIDGIPLILQGSTDSYKLTVVSNNSYTVNASLPANIKIYGNDQNVYTQSITVAANRGRLNITLYHRENSLSESDSELLTMARYAIMNIPGFALSCRFTGESPRHFYHYAIDEAPAGKWRLDIMFPGHSVSRQTSIWIPSNGTVSELFTLTETN